MGATGHQIEISRGRSILKMLTAVVTAAAIAALVTFPMSPDTPVEAGPVAKPIETAMMASVDPPWPYLHREGASLGNAQVRLITTDKLSP
jgi:hypothetical protein